MCFRFDSCFGGLSRQDYGRSTSKPTSRGGGVSRQDSGRSTSKATSRGGGGVYHWGGQAGHAHGYYSGAGHKSAAQAYHPQPVSGAGVWKNRVDDAGGHAAHAQDKANNMLKHPEAWNGKVGDYAGHNYMDRLHDAAPYHREHGVADYHHYPTTTATLAR